MQLIEKFTCKWQANNYNNNLFLLLNAKNLYYYTTISILVTMNYWRQKCNMQLYNIRTKAAAECCIWTWAVVLKSATKYFSFLSMILTWIHCANIAANLPPRNAEVAKVFIIAANSAKNMIGRITSPSVNWYLLVVWFQIFYILTTS